MGAGAIGGSGAAGGGACGGDTRMVMLVSSMSAVLGTAGCRRRCRRPTQRCRSSGAANTALSPSPGSSLSSRTPLALLALRGRSGKRFIACRICRIARRGSSSETVQCPVAVGLNNINNNLKQHDTRVPRSWLLSALHEFLSFSSHSHSVVNLYVLAHSSTLITPYYRALETPRRVPRLEHRGEGVHARTGPSSPGLHNS